MKFREKIFQKEFLSGITLGLFGIGAILVWGKSYGIYAFTILLLMAVLGCAIAVAAIVFSRAQRTPLEGVSLYEGAFLVIMAVCPLLLDKLGFFCTSALALFCIGGLSLQEVIPAKVLKLAAYILCVAAAAYVVFVVLLRIRTPMGILF